MNSAPPFSACASVAANDGFTLNVRHHRKPNSPTTVLLIGPPGLSFDSWKGQSVYLSNYYSVLSWDLRNTLGSKSTEKKKEGRFAISTVEPTQHREDALAVLAWSKATDVVAVGWGLGAQVALDLAQYSPELVRRAVMISPRFSPRFATSMGVGPSGLQMTRLWEEQCSSTFASSTPRRWLWPPPSWVSKKIGLVAPTVDDDLFERTRKSMERDSKSLSRAITVLREQESCASPETTRAPVLWLIAEDDAQMVNVCAKRLARRMPFGEVHTIDQSTACAPLEYPELIGLQIQHFIDRTTKHVDPKSRVA